MLTTIALELEWTAGAERSDVREGVPREAGGGGGFRTVGLRETEPENVGAKST